MRELSRLWDWLLPGLICLSPMGAAAYFAAGAEEGATNHELPAAERRAARASTPQMGAVVIPLGRL